MFKPKPINLLLSIAATLSLSSAAAAADLAVRKNVVDLSAQEKQDLVDAFYVLKNTIPEGSQTSIYDQFIAVHVGAMSLIHRHGPNEMTPQFSDSYDPAHGNSSFLPWHREYILRFEEALQSVNRDITLPYWDWTQAEALDVIFQEDFLGTNGQGVPVELPTGSPPSLENIPTDVVPNQGGALRNLGDVANIGTSTELEPFLSGPPPESFIGMEFEGGPLPESSNFSEASGWVLLENLNINPETGESLGTSLTRFLQVPPATEYPLPQEQIDRVQALDDYLLYRPALEGYITVDEEGNVIRGGFTHNYIHGFVGGAVIDDSDLNNIIFQGLGTMSNVPSSPYDPVFWLHHANADRLWAEWQADGHAGADYYPSTGQPPGHNLNDPMWPWDGGEMVAMHQQMGESDMGAMHNLLDELLAFLPPVEASDLVRPADVLDTTGLGYTYDTLTSSATAVPEPSSLLGLVSLALGVKIRRRWGRHRTR